MCSLCLQNDVCHVQTAIAPLGLEKSGGYPTSEQRSIRARFCHLVHIQDWEAAANMQVNNECDAVERVLDVTTESDR